MHKKILSIFVPAAALIFPLDAFAYLDAGTGSMIIQGLIGGIAAGFFVIRHYWHQLLVFFGIRKKQEAQTESEPPEGNQS